MKKIKWFLCLLITLLYTPIGLAAADDPIQMLQKTTDQLINTLKTEHAALKKNPKLIYSLVDTLLTQHVDQDAMARAVLGPVQWAKLNDVQRQSFTKEFLNVVIHTYASALNNYTDEVVRYYPLSTQDLAQDRLQVRSVVFQDGNNPIPMNYWVIRDNSQWKVYDMSVDGVSLLESFRAQFASELSQGSFEQLLSNLKKHNEVNQ